MAIRQKDYDPALMQGATQEETDFAIANGKLIIGDSNGRAQEVSMSGDATISNAGVITIAAGAVTYPKRSSAIAVTATDDGLTTGLITDGATFVTVTSAGATKAVTLPAIVAGGVGQTIDIYVGDNGYELLTPASSSNTINTVDSDGTNQLDVAANTLLRCVQVTATGWFAYQVAATTTTVVAPDND